MAFLSDRLRLDRNLLRRPAGVNGQAVRYLDSALPRAMVAFGATQELIECASHAFGPANSDRQYPYRVRKLPLAPNGGPSQPSQPGSKADVGKLPERRLLYPRTRPFHSRRGGRLPLADIEIETPLAHMQSPPIAGKTQVFSPVLRAGVTLRKACPIWRRPRGSRKSAFYPEPETFTAVYFLSTDRGSLPHGFSKERADLTAAASYKIRSWFAGHRRDRARYHRFAAIGFLDRSHLGGSER